MPNAVLANVRPTKKELKTYFPFERMLRSQEFTGKGAALAENCYVDDGFLRKLKGQSLLKDLTQAEIVWMSRRGYEKADGTFQILYAHASGGNFKLKALELDDLSIVTPSGGAGDVAFTSSNFDMVTIGTTGYISNESASTQGYSWDGAALTAITNFPTSPKFILRDGNRITTLKSFSGETLSDYTAGTGVAATGNYAISLEPVGGVEAGIGSIFFGKMGAEAHKVIPNNASDDVSAKTKIENFSYTGLGIQNTHQVVAGKNNVYFLNEEGIQEMNPYTGATTNLVDIGNIKRRYANFNLTNAIIEYDSKNDRICVIVRTRGQNDTCIMVDTFREDRAISISPGSYFSSMANVNNQLYGGSSHDGKVVKMFDTFTDRDGGKLTFRWIMEWDALTNAMLEKRLKQFSIFASLNPQSSFKALLRKDGSHDPIATQTFTTTAALGTGVLGTNREVWGKYILNLGGGRDVATSDTSTDRMLKTRKNSKISTYSLEIIETSFYDFKVYDVLLQWKTKGKLIRSETFPNTLF